MDKAIEKFSDRAVVVKKPNANFRIIYEIHNQPNVPSDFKNLDALAFEMYARADKSTGSICDDFLHKKNQRSSSYIRNILENERTLLYFIDVMDIGGKFLSLIYSQLMLKTSETGGGLIAGIWGIKKTIELRREFKNDRKIPRRSFLELAACVPAAFYFAGFTIFEELEFALEMWQPSKEEGFMRSIDRMFISLNEKAHPEILILMLTFRNKVWAQKLDLIANKMQKNLGRLPEIGILVGKNHIGLERTLHEKPEERLRYIRRIFNRPFVRSAVKISETQCFEYKSQKGWQTFEIIHEPDLEKIENG